MRARSFSSPLSRSDGGVRRSREGAARRSRAEHAQVRTYGGWYYSDETSNLRVRPLRHIAARCATSPVSLRETGEEKEA